MFIHLWNNNLIYIFTDYPSRNNTCLQSELQSRDNRLLRKRLCFADDTLMLPPLDIRATNIPMFSRVEYVNYRKPSFNPQHAIHNTIMPPNFQSHPNLIVPHSSTSTSNHIIQFNPTLINNILPATKIKKLHLTTSTSTHKQKFDIRSLIGKEVSSKVKPSIKFSIDSIMAKW